MMGGYHTANPMPFKVRSKEQENVEVAWADRLNEKIVDTLSDFSIHKVGLIREGDAPAEGEEDTRKLVVKKFLSPYDAYDYIKEHLKDGMMIMAKGNFSFSTYNDNTQRKFQIRDIFLSKSEEGFANFVQTVLVDEDSFSKDSLKSAKETGEIVINTRVVDYVSKINGKKVGKNMTFGLPITIKVNQENPAVTQTIVEKLFKVKKGKIREIAIEGQVFEGYEQEQVSEKDIKISKDIQELIAMGLYTMEDVKEKMTVRGNKVSKLVFARPFMLKDKDDAKKIALDINDEKYVPEDLIVEIEEEKKDDNIDLSSLETNLDGTDDNIWLTQLGLGE
jgi:hypothetical protein